MASPGLSADPVLMAILKGLGGFAAGGIPGAFGGVIGGIEGAERAQRELTEADQRIERERQSLRGAAMVQQEFKDDEERKQLLEQLGPMTAQSAMFKPDFSPNEFLDSQYASPVPPPLPPPTPEEEKVLEQDAAAADSTPADSSTSPAGVTADAFPFVNTADGKRRFNQNTLTTLDPRVILPHVVYTEADEARAKAAGFQSIYDTTLDYGRYDPKGAERAPLSQMSIGQVKAHQRAIQDRQKAEGTNRFPIYPDGTRGTKTSAPVGPYQLQVGTIEQLQSEMGLSDDDMFSPEVQDAMAAHHLEKEVLSKVRSGEKNFAWAQAKIESIWQGAKAAGPLALGPEADPNFVGPPSPFRPNLPSETSGTGQAAPEENFYPFRRKPAADPDPLRVGQQDPSMREQTVLQARRQADEAEAELRRSRELLRQDPVMARFTAGHGEASDRLLTRFAKIRYAYGTPSEQGVAVGLLNGINARNQVLLAARQHAQAADISIYEQKSANAREVLKQGGRLELAEFNSMLKAGLAVDKADLDRETNRLKIVQTANERRQTEERIADLKLRTKNREMTLKQIAEIPKVEERLVNQERFIGRAVRAREIIMKHKDELFDATGALMQGKFNAFLGLKDGQELQALFNQINAQQIRTFFGGQPSRDESVIALERMGPSMTIDSAANLRMLDGLINTLTDEYTVQHGEYKGFIEGNPSLDRKPIELDPNGQAYEVMRLRQEYNIGRPSRGAQPSTEQMRNRWVEGQVR